MPVKYTAKQIEVTDRKAKAIELRAVGLNFREILEEMIAYFGADKLPASYDERYVWRDVKDSLEKRKALMLETAQDMTLIELDRLDKLQTAIMPGALRGDLKAVDRVLKIMAQRAQLMGLNQPARSKVEVSDWRTQVLDLIKNGTISVSQAEDELGKDVVAGLLNAGSEDVIEGKFTAG